jgi:hypothetical protein
LNKRGVGNSFLQNKGLPFTFVDDHDDDGDDDYDDNDDDDDDGDDGDDGDDDDVDLNKLQRKVLQNLFST